VSLVYSRQVLGLNQHNHPLRKCVRQLHPVGHHLELLHEAEYLPVGGQHGGQHPSPPPDDSLEHQCLQLDHLVRVPVGSDLPC